MDMLLPLRGQKLFKQESLVMIDIDEYIFFLPEHRKDVLFLGKTCGFLEGLGSYPLQKKRKPVIEKQAHFAYTQLSPYIVKYPEDFLLDREGTTLSNDSEECQRFFCQGFVAGYQSIERLAKGIEGTYRVETMRLRLFSSCFTPKDQYRLAHLFLRLHE